jgi:hypothetical protein
MEFRGHSAADPTWRGVCVAGGPVGPPDSLLRVLAYGVRPHICARTSQSPPRFQKCHVTSNRTIWWLTSHALFEKRSSKHFLCHLSSVHAHAPLQRTPKPPSSAPRMASLATTFQPIGLAHAAAPSARGSSARANATTVRGATASTSTSTSAGPAVSLGGSLRARGGRASHRVIF